MMLFRRMRKTDIDAIYNLARQSGVGLTTLPKDKELLEQRLDWSCNSYKKKVSKPGSEYYFFVLEDPQNQQIVGTSAIEAKTGESTPFYSYKISKHTRICHSLGIRNDYEVLTLVNDNQGKSEMCTLFLSSDYRKNNNSLLLSKARFLFMAQHPERFESTVIAEMRGVSDDKGRSPFWDSVGINFFHIPFIEADRLTLSTNKQFIADLIPRTSIYVGLLPKKARDVIGHPHPATLPAMNILLREGFSYHRYVDIFDAGPTIEASLKQIKTIASSRLMTIQSLSNEVSSHLFLISNAQLDYKATLGHASIDEEKNTCIISKETAELLQVTCGDKLRIAPLITSETLPSY